MENEELVNEIKALRQELDELKSIVQDDIIGPVEKDWNDKKYKEALTAWKNKYGEKLSPYEEKLKATEGDDFDIWKTTYDEWNATEDDPDEWVDVLIEEIDKSLEPLAKVFGVPKEDLNATVEIENGEVADIQADIEPEAGEEVAEETVTEEPATEEEGGEEEGAEEEELSEEEAFQKELDEAYDKYKGQRSY